jgi:D-alanine-D-alanine ligase
MAGDRLIPLEEKPDVAFPVIHGTYGEDGTLQGLLEMVGIPYVGCGVFGSAAGMDKDKMKTLFRSADLPVVDSLTFRRLDWDRMPERIMDRIEVRLGYPCFVKPTNQGSSIGVSKASDRVELEQAMQLAAQYNGKIIVEQSVDCRELECSVLGNSDPIASVVGEVMMRHEFYDYEAKYLDDSSYTTVPADIPQGTAEEIRRMSVQAFLALDLSGLARVDFFLQRESGQIYINEVNTLPSFTPQCMYPKLCAASGLPYPQLLDRLIELAMERHADRSRNRSCL